MDDAELKALDTLNARYGRGTVACGPAGECQRWAMKCDHSSARYTTEWGAPLILYGAAAFVKLIGCDMVIQSIFLREIVMQSTILSALVVIILALLLISAFLIFLNWNDDNFFRILTGVAAGLAATIGVTMVGLKGETFNDGFMIFVPVNTAGLYVDLGDLTKAPWRSTNMNVLTYIQQYATQQVLIAGEKEAQIIFSKPADSKDTDRINLLAIQYYLLQQIITLQRLSSDNFNFAVSNDQVDVLPFVPIRPENMVLLPLPPILRELNKNPIFAKNRVEQMMWREPFMHVFFPPGSGIEITETPTSPTTGVEHADIIIRKRNFFTIEVTLEAAGSGFGLPKGFTFTQPVTSYAYRVRMTAKFDRLSAANAHTQEYKDWVRWLFASLKEQNHISLAAPSQVAP